MWLASNDLTLNLVQAHSVIMLVKHSGGSTHD